MTLPDTLARRQQLDLAEKVARQRYKGAVGELLAREIHGWRELAYLGETDSLLGDVVDDLTRPPVILWDGPGEEYTPAGFAHGYDFIERPAGTVPIDAYTQATFIHWPHPPARTPWWRRRQHWSFQKTVTNPLVKTAWIALGTLIVVAIVTGATVILSGIVG